MFRMVKDLKFVLGKENGGGNKKTKKAGTNAENNGNETSGLFKKVNILEPTILEGLDGASCN
jgi:hypothetical protein